MKAKNVIADRLRSSVPKLTVVILFAAILLWTHEAMALSIRVRPAPYPDNTKCSDAFTEGVGMSLMVYNLDGQCQRARVRLSSEGTELVSRMLEESGWYGPFDDSNRILFSTTNRSGRYNVNAQCGTDSKNRVFFVDSRTPEFDGVTIDGVTIDGLWVDGLSTGDRSITQWTRESNATVELVNLRDDGGWAVSRFRINFKIGADASDFVNRTAFQMHVADGENTLHVWVTDYCGHRREGFYRVDFATDTRAPTARFILPPGNATMSARQKLVVEIAVNDPGADQPDHGTSSGIQFAELYLDVLRNDGTGSGERLPCFEGESWIAGRENQKSCILPTNVTDWSVGRHDLTLVVQDVAGNRSEISQPLTVVAD